MRLTTFLATGVSLVVLNQSVKAQLSDFLKTSEIECIWDFLIQRAA